MATDKKPAPKPSAPKLTDDEQVAAFMAALEHPLEAEIEAGRGIFKGTSPALSERIKWNAPSYITANHPAPLPSVSA